MRKTSETTPTDKSTRAPKRTRVHEFPVSDFLVHLFFDVLFTPI